MPRWGPRDLQAGHGSRDQPGSGGHTKHRDKKDFSHLSVGCLSLLGLPFILNSAFSPCVLLNHFKYWSSCKWLQATQLLL